MDPHSFIARAEAQRWLGIAEKLLMGHDLVGSKTFAIRARESDPRLEAADQILAIADTLLAAEKRVVGSNGAQQPDFYAILQLVRFVQDTEHIASQYRRLAVMLNPHQNRFPYSDQAFQLVNDAWAVLSNPMRKSMYDSELDFPSPQMNPIGFNLEQQHQQQQQHHHHQQQQHNFFSINHMGSGHEQELPEPQTFQTRVQQSHQQQLQQHNFLSQPNPVRPLPVREQEQLFQVTSAPQHREQEHLFQSQVQPFQITSTPQHQTRSQPQTPQPQPRIHSPTPPPPTAPPQSPFSWPQASPLSQQQQPQPSPPQHSQPQPQQQQPHLQPQPQQQLQQKQRQQLQQEQQHQQQEHQKQLKQEQQRQQQLQQEQEHQKQLQEQQRQQQLQQEQQHQQQLKQEQEHQKQLKQEQERQQQLQQEKQHQQQMQQEQQHQQLQQEQQHQQQLQQRQEALEQNTGPVPVPLPSEVNINNGVMEEEAEPEPELETETAAEDVDESPTFWTSCPFCFYMYEYPKVYAECTLRCDHCKRAFQAVRVRSPPPIIEGQDAYFYCWGYFPVGVSMSHLENNGKSRNANWTPFSPLYDASSNVQDHLNGRAAPKENPFVNKSSGPRIYIDDMTDDVVIDVSEPSDESDVEWNSIKNKKLNRMKRDLKVDFKSRSQVLAIMARDAGNGNVKNRHQGMPTPPVAESSKKPVGSNPRMQSADPAKELGKLDLNVEFHNNEGEDPAPRTSGGNRGNGQGEEDNIEGISFFEGLDEFLSSLPILSVVNEEKVKAS